MDFFQHKLYLFAIWIVIMLSIGLIAEQIPVRHIEGVTLGFLVLRIQTEFPDCEAMRVVGENRLQRVKIECEYESRNFLKHMHEPTGCDLIVCWEHNWPECPLEVVELKTAVSPQTREENLTTDSH